MRKQLTVILLSALILSGCASGRMGNPGAIVGGAAIGGSLGSSIGGLIGDNNRGWRGGYRGSAIGNIVGTIAGAAIGNALTAPKPDPMRNMLTFRKSDKGSLTLSLNLGHRLSSN